MVPYYRDPEAQRKLFQLAARKATSHLKSSFGILAFHNEVAGCQQSAHSKGTGLSHSDIQADVYNLCIGGHIHRPQAMTPKQGTPVWYPGSPFCMDWSEVNEQKSIFCLDIDEKTLKHKITLFPSKVPGWYDSKAPGFVPQKDWTGTRIRVTVPVALDAVKELSIARKACEKRYPGANLHVVPEFPASAVAPTTVDVTKSDEKLLQSYLEKISLPEGITVGQVVAYLQKFLPSIGLFGVQGLKFGKFQAKNVLCFEDVLLDLDRKGLTLITGKNNDWQGEGISNGSGKSSLCTLPFVALFGRTFKNQTFDGWARQDASGSSYVIQHLELPDGRKLKIWRGRKPAVLRVFLDDQEVSMGDKDASQTYIERLTNLTWSVLTNAVYIGQREIGSVFGTEKERKELFSRLLGLDRFLEAQEKIRKVLSRARDAVESALDDIRAADAMIVEARSGRKETQTLLDLCPRVAPETIASKEKEATNVAATIRKNEHANTALEPTLDANQKQYEGYFSRTCKAEAEIESLRKLLAGTHVSGRCRVCGGKVSVKVLEEYQQELQQKIEEQERILEEYESKQEVNRVARQVLIEKVQSNNFQTAKFRSILETLQKDTAALKVQSDAQQRLVSMLDSKDRRLAHFTKIKTVHENAHTAWLEEVQFLVACSDAVGRNGLPAYLCSVVAPQLNASAARYSEAFTEGEIGVQFEMSSGDIDVRVCNAHGGKSIKDQSAGEMRMAGIITALAFRDALVPHNILILDEPSEGLDASNAAAFACGLNSVIDRFQHVLIISHNERLLSELDPDFHITVEKRNGISTIREETV
jgi:DNA repair exonuclease SbcCD ATPase subunit